MKEIPVSQIKGFKIGHAQDLEHATGCTAILCEQGAWAGVDVRGGSPASRETELLRPVNTVQQINCVMLSGGSAFGLEAGDGAMQFLEEKGFGFDTGFGKVPIVCGASLFDLELVTNKVRPWAMPPASTPTAARSPPRATWAPAPGLPWASSMGPAA